MSRTSKAANYPMRVYFDGEVKEWVAEVVDLPGCTGAGDSASEAVAAAASFVPDWIEVAKERGIPVAKPAGRLEASGKFVVRVSKALHSRLQDRAAIEQTSLNQLAVQYLSEGLSSSETADRILLRVEETMSSGLYQGMVQEVRVIDVGKSGWSKGSAYPGGAYIYEVYKHHVVPESARKWDLDAVVEIQKADTRQIVTFPVDPTTLQGEEEECQSQTN